MENEKNGEWQPLVDYCFDLYDKIEASDYRKRKLEAIKESYRIYEQIEKASTFPWKDASNVVLPMHTITVDNLEPRLWSGITGKKPIVQLEMEGMTEQDELTKIIEDWFNQELEKTVKIEDEAGTIVHKALLEGTLYPIASYDEDEVITRDFVYDASTGNVAIDAEGNAHTQDNVESIFKGGKVEYAEFGDVYVSDDADDWEASDVIRAVKYTYAELQRQKDKPGWMNIDESLLGEVNEGYELGEGEQSPSQEVVGVKVTGQETIDCLECCVRFTFKTGKDDDKGGSWENERYVALIAKDSKTLIRIRLLRDLNFRNEHLIKRIRLYKEHGRAYGSSMYEKIKSIQNGASDIFNMVVNVATVTMIPWFLYTDKAGMDGEAVITPGKGIKVDDPSNIVFPRFNQNPRSYIVFIEMFMSLWEKLGSIGDIQIGRLSESRKDATATETMAAIQEGNIKHNYQSKAFKEEFMSLIRTLYDLYYQKMPHDKTFIYRGKPMQIPRMAMKRKYKFKLSGSTDMSNKVLEMQKNEQMYKTLRQDPITNPIELIGNLVESFKPDSDKTKYINPQINQLVMALQQNPEIMQVIGQYLQQKQQQVQQQQQAQQVNQAQVSGKAQADAMMERLQQVGANAV